MLSYWISAGNVFTTLLFSSHPPPPFLPGQRNAGARGQSGEDSWMCLSMVCEAASDVASHASNVFRSICWFWIRFPNANNNFRYYVIKGTAEIWGKVHPSQELHVRPRPRHLLQLCCCSVLVWSADLAMAGIWMTHISQTSRAREQLYSCLLVFLEGMYLSIAAHVCVKECGHTGHQAGSAGANVSLQCRENCSHFKKLNILLKNLRSLLYLTFTNHFTPSEFQWLFQFSSYLWLLEKDFKIILLEIQF